MEDHAPGVGRCAVAKRRGDGGRRGAVDADLHVADRRHGAPGRRGPPDGHGREHQIERLQGGNSLGGTFALKFRDGDAARSRTTPRRWPWRAPSSRTCRTSSRRRRRGATATASAASATTGSARTARGPAAGLEWTLTLVTLDDVITPRAPVGYDWKGAPRGPLDGDVYDETPTAAPTYDTLAPSYDTSVPSLKPTGEWLEPEGPCRASPRPARYGGGGLRRRAAGPFLSHRPILAATNRTAFGCEASFTLAFGGGGAAHAAAAARRRPATATRRGPTPSGRGARPPPSRGGKNSILSSYANPARRRRRAARARRRGSTEVTRRTCWTPSGGPA